MTAEWLLRSVTASVLVAAAALAVDGVLRATGRPRRSTWAAALAVALGLSLLSAVRPAWVPSTGLLRVLSPERPAAAESILVAATEGSVSAASGSARAGDGGEFTPGALEASDVVALLEDVLPAVWALASFALLIAFSLTWQRTRRARASMRPAIVDGVAVLLSDRWGPAVVGVRRPEIVLPRWIAEGAPAERRLVLAHEREHVEAGDSRLLAAAVLPLILAPLNPVLWWLRLRLHEAIETDCDARVIAAGADRRAYVAVLLNTAAAGRRAGGLELRPAFARRASVLERRLLMMTGRLPSRPLVIALPLSVLAVGMLLVACEVLAPATGSPTPSVASMPGPVPPRTSGGGGDLARPRVVGTIAGTVLDEQTGAPIANAQVYLDDTGIGRLSGPDGTYVLRDVPEGTYRLVVVYPGFAIDRHEEVRVGSGSALQVSHRLRPTAVAMAELLVRPGGVEAQPVDRQEAPAGPARNITGGPIFTPMVVMPELRNRQEVGDALVQRASNGGRLVLWAYIGEQGQVLNTRIIQGSGSEQLDRAADSAVREVARFNPALNRDQRVPVWVQLPITLER